MRFNISIPTLKHLILGVVVSTIFGALHAQTETIAESKSNLVKEISTPKPIYPRGGWQKSEDGSVTLRYDISEHGEIFNVCILSSTVPGFFELYAVQAAKATKYEHTTDPPQLVRGIEKEFNFTLDSGPRVRVQPKYPRQALEYGYQGFVVVEFRVASDGSVHNEKVVGADPAVIFDKAAMDAARKFKFDTDRFAPNDRVQHRFNFSLDSNPNSLAIADYPTSAKEKEIEGHVVVKFDVNNNGKVENTDAIYTTSRELTSAAVSAVEQFTFNADEPITGIHHKVDFILNRDYQLLKIDRPEYPRQAVLDNVEGFVIVRYDINERGLVENLSVHKAQPPDIFNESAVTSVTKYKYTPRYINGRPTSVEGTMSRIVFSLGNEGEASSQRAQRNSRNFRLNPVYELNLNGNHKDGSVIVEFDVNKEGFVERPEIVEVIDTNLTQTITDQILDTVSYSWFWPSLVYNNPIRVRNLRQRIDLRFTEN